MVSKTIKKPLLQMLTSNVKTFQPSISNSSSNNNNLVKKFPLPQIKSSSAVPVVTKEEKPADDGEETISIVDINDRVIGGVKRKMIDNKPGI
jgi:hypothetical protein